MFVDGRIVPISPFGTNTGEARVSGHGGRIVMDAGRGEDDIQVSNLGCGRYNVRVNGKHHTFSREEMQQLHIKGGKGSDRITIGPGVDIPVTADGGKGNDSIINYSNGA